MPRSRSRSPRRDKDRDRKRSRSRERRRRHRSRSPRNRRSPYRRSRSRSPRREAFRGPKLAKEVTRYTPFNPQGNSSNHCMEKKVVRTEKLDDSELEMVKLMGFCTFDTTKGKKTEETTNAGDASISKKRRYRQYMNRKGGFNRPLDFVA